MSVYFDTSALVKRYVPEAGGSTVLGLLRQYVGDSVSSDLSRVELASTLKRAANAKRIKADRLAQIVREALGDLGALNIMAMDEAVVVQAQSLCLRHDLRTLDALHLACALQAGCTILVSSDDALLAAAKGEGLKIVKV